MPRTGRPVVRNVKKKGKKRFLRDHFTFEKKLAIIDSVKDVGIQPTIDKFFKGLTGKLHWCTLSNNKYVNCALSIGTRRETVRKNIHLWCSRITCGPLGFHTCKNTSDPEPTTSNLNYRRRVAVAFCSGSGTLGKL